LSVLGEFRGFALRGGVVPVAIGFTVGAVLTSAVKSLVDDILMPRIGLLLAQADFSNLFLVVREGAERPGSCETLAQARAAGAVTLSFGVLANNVVAFLTVAACMFAVVRLLDKLDERLGGQLGREKGLPGEPREKTCPFCLTAIPCRAVRCPACTSHLEGERAAE